jgi:hypothetical protein
MGLVVDSQEAETGTVGRAVLMKLESPHRATGARPGEKRRGAKRA